MAHLAFFFQPDCTEYTFSQIPISKKFYKKTAEQCIDGYGTSNSLLGSLLCGYFLHWFPTFEGLNSHWMSFDIKGEITSLCHCNHWHFPGLSNIGSENYCCKSSIQFCAFLLCVSSAFNVLSENMKNKFVSTFCELFVLTLKSQ